MSKDNEPISLRGNKVLWTKFVNKVREKRFETKKNVWDTLKELIEKFLREN